MVAGGGPLVGILETIAGIGVSIVLFVLGYRSTIGARKERIRAARAEIVRVLLRLVAVDGDELTLTILQRTIAGIAAQHGVEALAVGPPSLIANLLYAEIMTSDLMDGSVRESVRNRIEGAFRIDLGETGEEGEAEQGVKPIRPAPAAPTGAAREIEGSAEKFTITYNIPRAESVEREERESKRETGTTVAIGIISTIVGIALSALVWLTQNTGLDKASLLAALGGTVATMAGIVGVFITRQREQNKVQEENIREAKVARSELDSYRRVLRALNEAGSRVSTAGPDDGADARIELEDGTTMLVELKRYVDRKTLSHVAERLNRARQEQSSTEGVIVVLNPPPESVMSRLERDLPDQIHLMTGDDFIHALQDDPAARRARMRGLK